jgi:hypothetical protein
MGRAARVGKCSVLEAALLEQAVGHLDDALAGRWLGGSAAMGLE